MKKIVITLSLLLALISIGDLDNAYGGDNKKVMVFAAASTTNAVTDICELFNGKDLGRAIPSFASSSTLAKQIENGAPADIYISANIKWMDYLEDKKLIEKGSRLDLLGNRIVLIAPASSSLNDVKIENSFPLLDLLKKGKLAMGDPDHVPAGIYGRQALVSLGVWEKLAPVVARTKDVRAALSLVERGECPLGVVYATDAAISEKVKVVGIFPADCHPPIIYPVALLAGDSSESALAFFKFLKSPEARIIFEKYGFRVR